MFSSDFFIEKGSSYSPPELQEKKNTYMPHKKKSKGKKKAAIGSAALFKKEPVVAPLISDSTILSEDTYFVTTAKSSTARISQ